MLQKLVFFLSITFLWTQCTSEKKGNNTTNKLQNDLTMDHHSFGKPNEIATKHLALDLEVDFSSQKIKGKVSLTLENHGFTTLHLDTRNLNIQKVTLGDKEEKTKFTLGDTIPFLGQDLAIEVKPETNLVHVYYETTAGADALQWLSAAQTSGKSLPYLFTQGQAILTRTWIPCQDSPGNRTTYSARVKVPKELMVVMSADNPQAKNNTGIYTFEMKQPIPPYLIAMTVGNLAFKSLGERTGVYAEPEMLEKSAYEFVDMEKMLIAAENLYGKYLWGRYDVIVLPPSFPFGGMENPKLTFATPTIITGDRSLTSLVAHELAHSWSGNLVTNATWNDFWLNEGFTVYFERRIMESLYGADYAEMLALLGYQDLKATIESLGQDSADTHLFLALKGRDADDGMNDIAYEKGYLMLRTIESIIGRSKFDAFLKEYFHSHAFQSIDTKTFIDYFYSKIPKATLGDFTLEAWIYAPGIPAGHYENNSKKFALIDKKVEAFIKNDDIRKWDTKSWTTHEWLHFIRNLPKDLDQEKMKNLDLVFNFSDSGNAEILDVWFELAIYNGYIHSIEDKLEAFLVSVGRRKFLTPLYKGLKETNQLELAKKIYNKARPNYHSVATHTMDELLGYK